MKAVFCKNNVRKRNSDRVEECRRLLAVLPNSVVSLLKDKPGERVVVRCPRCAATVRWIAIYADNDGKLTFDPGIEPGLWQEIDFDNVLAISED